MVFPSFYDAYVDVKYKFFKTYCMSLYGCALWDLDSSFISKFYVSWRKGIRKLLGLPLLTHSEYLSLACDIPIKGFIIFSSRHALATTN